MSQQRTVRIGHDHPALPGHFPGNPVVPGVVILDEVVETLRQWQPTARVEGLAAVKFLSPLLPGRDCTIQLEQAAPDKVRFSCTGSDGLLAQGQLRCSGGAAE